MSQKVVLIVSQPDPEGMASRTPFSDQAEMVYKAVTAAADGGVAVKVVDSMTEMQRHLNDGGTTIDLIVFVSGAMIPEAARVNQTHPNIRTLVFTSQEEALHLIVTPKSLFGDMRLVAGVVLSALE